MKKAILITVLGTVTSLNSFAGPASGLIKQVLKSEEAAEAQLLTQNLTKKGLESKIAMDAVVKNSPKELVVENGSFTAVAQTADNAKSGIIQVQTVLADGSISRSAVPIADALVEPTKKSLTRENGELFLARTFPSPAGDIEIIQGYTTGLAGREIIGQNSYTVTSSTLKAILRASSDKTSVSGRSFVGVYIDTKAGLATGSCYLEDGFRVIGMKINSSGTKLTVAATNGNEAKEFAYAITVDDNKEKLKFALANFKTLTKVEVNQFMVETKSIAGRKSLSAPVRGMQIENVAN